MSTQVQLRRGTAAQHATFVGAPGEITVVTDENTIRVHDGVTPGGHEVSDGDLRQIVEELQIDFNAHLAETAADDVHGLLSGGKIIQESGRNTNGGYLRFADGTQICTKILELDFSVVGRQGDFPFPASFYEQPVCSIGFSTSTTPSAMKASGSAYVGNTGVSLGWFVGINDTHPGTIRITLTAIGRWK